MLVHNPLNYNYLQHVDDEEMSQELITVPDQTLSIREILNRFTRGLPITGAKVPIFSDNDDSIDDPSFPDLATLDISERQQYMEDYAQQLNEIRQRNKRPRMPKGQHEAEPNMRLENVGSESEQSGEPLT